MSMNPIATKLEQLTQSITITEQRYDRAPGSVKLLVVSKGQPVELIQQAIAARQYYFGENYVQEALPKIVACKHPDLEWHFIGSIQSNKTKAIAGNFNWVHSVCRLDIAERLSQQRPKDLPPLNICIEVNVSRETSKSGLELSQLRDLAFAIAQLPQIKLRGLMAIPAPTIDLAQQRIPYRKLRLAFEELKSLGLQLDTLSMGTSNDFEAAIAEGSTLVRLGTAIFGAREKE